ncbi:MAG: nucleotide kinase domain-containing protein [Bacteroidota bacterium]
MHNSSTLLDIRKKKTPYIYIKLLPAVPTIAFDTYWKFAAERQSIYMKRLRGEKLPWTNDAILSKYKFTNVYRITDRVSQYLVRNVIYNPNLPSDHEEVFFRIMMFKIFNKIETWELLVSKFGLLSYSTYDIENIMHKNWINFLRKAWSK